MSWKVDGRTYHDYGEYQRALNTFNERSARERASRAGQDVRRHRQRVQELQAELSQAHTDLGRQRVLNEQIQREVAAIGRVQQRLAETQRRFEAEAAERFNSLDTDIRGTQENLEHLQAAHQQHVHVTRAAFEATHHTIQVGLAEAESRRLEGERRLQEAVAAVDHKVESDRQARLRTRQAGLDQARENIAIVEEALNALHPTLVGLNLDEEENSVREFWQKARAQYQQGNASAAMANSDSAFATVRNLTFRAEKRRAELAAARADIAGRLASLESSVDAPLLDLYFKREKALLSDIIKHRRDQLASRYHQYNQMLIDLRQDEPQLDKLEGEVSDWLASAKNIEEQFIARKKRAGMALEVIHEIYGGKIVVPEKPAHEEALEDLKAPVIFECTAGNGERFRVTAKIDGDIQIEAAGHATQGDCERKAQRIVQALQKRMQVTGHETRVGNPPGLPSQQIAGTSRTTEQNLARLQHVAGRQ